MISGSQFIDLAGKLAVRPAEAEQRTAISRAYYGACHLAKAYIEGLGIEVKVTMHDLDRWLSVNDNPEVKRAGQKLSDQHSHRIRADYKIDEELARHSADPVRLVQMCVESAREIESLLRECSREEIKQQVQASIRRFLTSDPKLARSYRNSAN